MTFIRELGLDFGMNGFEAFRYHKGQLHIKASLAVAVGKQLHWPLVTNAGASDSPKTSSGLSALFREVEHSIVTIDFKSVRSVAQFVM